MKLKNIFAVAFATFALASCSDDDKSYDLNTAPGVTVEMGESEITVVENAGLFSVPIVVNGDANGYITVTVEVADGEYDSEKEIEPALDDVNYYITTKIIRIAPDTKTANIEVRTQDNNEENFTRVFYMSIKSVEGATVANDNYTQINIKNKSIYNNLGGRWYATGVGYQGEPVDEELTLIATDPEEKVCYLTNWGGNGDLLRLTFEYNYDRDTEIATLSFVYGSTVGSNLPFGDPIGTADIVATTLDDSTSGSMVGTFNEDMTECTFPATDGFILSIYKSGVPTGYLFGMVQGDFKLSRTKSAE